MKDKLITFVNKHKCSKIFAAFGIVAVLLSCMIIPSFAAEDTTFQTIAPITFNDFSGNVTAVAFPGAHTEQLYIKSDGTVSVEKDYLNYTDYNTNSATRIKTMTYNGATVSYFELYVYCNYSSIYVNYYPYDASISGSSNYILTDINSFVVAPLEHTYNSSTQYSYRFSIILYTRSAYDAGYEEGYAAGQEAGYDAGYTAGGQDGYVAGEEYGYSNGYTTGVGVGYDQGYNAGSQAGYDQGFAAGAESTDSGNLGHNLLGDTLNAPMNALNNFTIYDPDPSDNSPGITLGLVVGGVICLSLFIAFLKIFAGG